ncbi:MDR family MFS transporter [Cellulosimicrobium arenosum]|uniref:MDR family MFS transporter n=1 Tax=Cellulosimicrobium arenosum TaxID=2708133 RepID=UPI0030CA25D4
MTASPTTTHAPPGTLSRQNFLVIALLLVSTFVAILNETTMSVAVPVIMDEFGVTAASGQWLMTAFLLTMAVVIPTTGWFIGRVGTRVAYLTAMSIFSVGTLLAALAPTFGVLLGARVLQASGTAVLFPLLMTTVMTLVPAARRGQVMGNVSLVISVAPALGPTMSGAVIEIASWRWTFGVVLPIALIAFAIGTRYVRNTAERTQAHLDLLSVLLAVGAFGGLVYGMSAFGESAQGGAGLPGVPLWAPLAAGAVLLVLFGLRQLSLQKHDDALLDLRVFRSRGFSTGLGILATGMVAMFGVIILLPMLLQDVLGLTTLQTGLTMLPGGILMGVLSPGVGRLYDRFGPRPLAVPGLLAVATAMFLLTRVHEGSPAWNVLVAHVVLSLGLAFVFTPLFTTALSSVRPDMYAHGSATLATLQQLAGAAGTAIFVAIMSTAARGLEAGGESETSALAGGIDTAFMVGAVVALVAAVVATTLSKPVEQDGAPHPHGGSTVDPVDVTDEPLRADPAPLPSAPVQDAPVSR